jgi:hypothetical protein
VSGLRGELGSIRRLNKKLLTMSTEMSQKVARRAASALSYFARTSYGANNTVYDDPRKLSVDGNPLSLVRTGRVKRDLYFVADGTKVRMKFGPKYAKYLIGKYTILPIGKATLPWKWQEALQRGVDAAMRDHLAGGGK